ncbi:MAG TPA: ATP-binding protein, partial [Pyrinomonadaceae bacterium]|nr:ATP-binding protein [Pyrinomonadaceae bacterium]
QSRLAARLFHPDVTPLCVTEEQVQTLLDDVDQLVLRDTIESRRATLTPDEHDLEQQLRQMSLDAQNKLPLDRIVETLELSEFEQEAILLCAAVELDRSYERIFAYILDDLNRRFPCIELLSTLTANSLEEVCTRRAALGVYGKLRRTGILRPFGEPATSLRQELRLSPSLLTFLTGAPGDVSSWFRDAAAVSLPSELAEIQLPADVEIATIERLGQSLRDGSVSVLGIWGPRQSGIREVSLAVAVSAALPLRRLVIDPNLFQHAGYEQPVAESIKTAAALNSALLVETDVLTEHGNENLRPVSHFLANALASAAVPVILTGSRPWRPTELLKSRSYAQIETSNPAFKTRQAMWHSALPELTKEQRDDLASRFRMSSDELDAVALMAGTQARVASNGHAKISEQVEEACDAVTRKHTYNFATAIRPKRGPDDLVLPPMLHKQVIEIARFHRTWPRIADAWGFGRLLARESGIKVLFTGPSGTGKTLAAEVIAFDLGMTLLKIDLSRVVSKWVGETERNLDRAFAEAEDSNSVLFFDEADSLFSKRGEVRHGVDRYSNLEVSYLLQRLESYHGLVILASNLRENIDPAFIRRFQVVLNFSRPDPPERRRLWSIAFPKSAPLQADIDFDLLSKLEMTGASIVSAAQTAALLAMESAKSVNGHGGPANVEIEPVHVVRAIARQYQREARLLTASELGPYGQLVHEVP